MVKKSTTCLAAVVVVATSAIACTGGDAPDGVQVRRHLAGDTVVLTSTGAPYIVVIDSLRVMWRSDELERPVAMALGRTTAGDRLVVGDRRRVHILAVEGEAVPGAVTVGREGGGPGEYRRIEIVGFLGTDSVAVYDSQNQRLTTLSPDGTLLGSTRVSPQAPWINVDDGQPLVAWRSGLLWSVTGAVAVGGPIRRALVWHDLATDTSAALDHWEGGKFVQLGMVFGNERMFDRNPMVALGPGPLAASGDGLEYCVTLDSLAVDDTLRRLCRDRPRTRVGEGIRNPDLSVLERDERRLGLARALLQHQEIPEHLPSYDRILFASNGDLWVRTVGRELAEVFPVIRNARPDLGPSHREWDVFDTVVGRVRFTVRMPAPFEPKVISESAIYGFYELPTGEIAIGGMRVSEGDPE